MFRREIDGNSNGVEIIEELVDDVNHTDGMLIDMGYLKYKPTLKENIYLHKEGGIISEKQKKNLTVLLERMQKECKLQGSLVDRMKDLESIKMNRIAMTKLDLYRDVNLFQSLELKLK